ncbi:ATP-dependent DNA helicase Q4 [Aphidius gifuensis]|uniref:ATP-dependent DNA helicase Q4 n=1 Tax=Aphidius gifuensis TaxID=684658 RepID=UPI001CDC034A|nr:ATP-dependent DNA helicase Q4 [Aphidius gifuensis]
MEFLENPNIKNRYNKYKYRLKKWENEFMEKYGRPPSKNDFHKADAVVRYAYNKYWSIKTQALDESLCDITFDDESQANVSANITLNDMDTTSVNEDDKTSKLDESKIDNDNNLETNTSMNNSLDKSIKNVENIAPITTPIKSPVIIDTINIDGAWGEHLNKDNQISTNKKSLSITRSSSFQLSQKKFNSGSFIKRNPRKSLLMNRTKSKIDLNSSSTSQNDINNTDKNDEDFDKSIFGDGIKIIENEKINSGHSVNTINRLLNNEKSLILDRKINAGWLDRCAKENNLEPIVTNSKRLSATSDSGIDTMDSPPDFQKLTTENKIVNPIISDDDEDYVCNSDSDEEHRKKRTRNWRKTMSDNILNKSKKICTGLSSTNSQNYNSPVTALIQKPITQIQDNNQTIEKKLIAINKIDETKKIEEKIIIENEKPTSSRPSRSTEDKIIDEKLTTIDCKKTNEEKIIIENEYDYNEEEEKDEEEEEEKPKRKSTSTRTTRSTKSKVIAKKKSPTVRKTTTRKTTRSTRKKIELPKDDDNDDDDEASDKDHGEIDKIKITSNGPELPIYGIESFDVVPRFSIPTDTNGDLVSEFSKTIDNNDTLTFKKPIEKKKLSTMSDKEKLEAKIASGKINDNFVRINLKKKIYSRGKKSFNFSRYKKNQWKHKKLDLASSESALDLADLAEKNSCFKCGESGHVSRRCPSMKSDELMPLDEDDSSDFLTLEEAELQANKESTNKNNETEILPKNHDNCDEHDFEFNDDDFDEELEEENSEKKIVGHKIPADLLAKLLPPINGAIEPLYSAEDDGKIIDTPKEVFDTLKMFGHEKFRPGQEKAIMRILSGQSTLVTLSTGSGKSLCYQLPAYLYAKRSHCITLVVSPLVSLMDDQVTGVPNFLRAAALHTGQTSKVREKIIETIKNGELDILLVSPEAIVAGEKSSGFGALLRQLPPIAFVCIDEAHCISQWSHNFRPSYLIICRVLIEKMGVKTILGLTATATNSTATSIVEHIQIHDGLSGVIADIPMPNNLILSVLKDDQKDHALVDLLKSERFKNYNSIIVYCTRREECMRIAGYLRISLQNTIDINKPKPKAKVSQICEAYHAGMAAGRRKVIQKSFMKGDIKIVVATVAFGMGINKSDIRSVIHYNMPPSFEDYVQSVGRAGRDNLPAHCHLFLNPKEDSDKWELRRHIYANGVDRHSIRRLLQKVFVPCSCRENSLNKSSRCPGHEVAFSIDETVKTLDVSEETISTLLCYLELHPRKLVTILSSVYITAKVSSYAGPNALKIAAQSSPPLAMAFAMDAKKGITHENDSIIEFPVVDIAAAIGWDSGVVKSHLKNLEWTIVNGKSKRSPISVRYETLGLRVRAPGDLTDTELDDALETLYQRTQSQQISALHQLEAIHAALNKFSHKSIKTCMELNDDTIEKSENLKKIIRQYFQSDTPLSIIDIEETKKSIPNESQIIADVRSLICSYRDNNFTGRAIARIFHGIQSPNYSALTWCRCRYWRAHLQTDFDIICQIATKEILAMR